MSNASARVDEVVDGRYRLGQMLGCGGMATVYEAIELRSQRRLALKRLNQQDDPKQQQRAAELFEREYHTLSELAHPRIVSVYDYASNAFGTYYTMELLDGGDLEQLVPMPWARACAVARDICSALSIVHSRRMVYRDLSPRNVRCTSDGLAKLIDFGALAVAGHKPRMIIGTPAFCAPENVRMATLDGRTDLYSLGATLYHALTGTYAYRAADLATLEFVWQTPPVPPCAHLADLPQALERLVLDLLCLDPDGRPASAAEVIERLCAIDGTPIDERLLFAQAYLSTPRFCGRDAQTSSALRKLSRIQSARGCALLIEGPSGVGRSRFLEACVLAAKLDGAAVLVGDADAASPSDYGVLRAIACAAFEVLPEQALSLALPALPVLAHVVPELHAHMGNRELQWFDSQAALRAAVQPALRAWILALSRVRPLVIAIDDLHAADEPSTALFALLVHDLAHERLGVLMTVDRTQPSAVHAALELIAQTASIMKLEPLAADAIQALLCSIFGDVPNLAVLSHRLNESARGNPRDCMRLAQHLVDLGLIRYRAGAWTLPENFDAADVPASIATALQARVARLDGDARDLANAFALCPERALAFEACMALTEHAQAGRLFRSLGTLVKEEVLRPVADQYALAQQAWVPVLLADQSIEAQRILHGRVARMFERHGRDELRTAQHLLLAGEEGRAVEVLVIHGERAQEQARDNPEAFARFARELPTDWFQLYEAVLTICQGRGYPPRYAYLLRSRICALASFMGFRDPVHGPCLVTQLAELCGLADYALLSEAFPAMDRLRRAFEAARARYDACAEQERVVDPATALRQLGRTVAQTTGAVVATLDVPGCRKLPNLTPLIPLSPAFLVISKLVEGTLARITGRDGRAAMGAVLARTGEPDQGGLDNAHHRYTRVVVMSGVGIVEAGMGLASSLSWAEQIANDPTSQVKALQIQMLYHLWQGNLSEAAHCKKRAEILQIQNSPREWAQGAHLPWQAAAHAACDDLTRTKQTLDEIEPYARRFPGWEPVARYARGECERLRGDNLAALEQQRLGLALTAPGDHQLWAHLAGAELRALLALGRAAEALDLGARYAAAATRAELWHLGTFIRMPLSLSQAGDEAIETSQAVIEQLLETGTSGIMLGLAYETRALIASAQNDRDTAERIGGLAIAIYRAHVNPALTAKCERLRYNLRRTAAGLAEEFAQEQGSTPSRVATMLQTCGNAGDRARAALALLVKHSAAQDAALFLWGTHSPYCAVECAVTVLPAMVRELAQSYLTAQVADADSTADESDQTSQLHAEWSEHPDMTFRPVLLSHEIPGGLAVTGVAVLAGSDPKGFHHPYRLATEISRQLQQFGDVTAMIVAY
jgi:hypothetical protein